MHGEPRQPRVFVGLTEVAGYFGNLELAFRSIGLKADFVDESYHSFAYRRPTLLGRLAELTRTAMRRSSYATHPLAARGWWAIAAPLRVAKALAHCWLFASAVGRYDAFIFCGGDSLLPRNADLPILRRLGKRVIWVFTGSDHRPPYLDGLAFTRSRGGGGERLIEDARRTRDRVRRAEKYAHWVVALPASAQFHVRPFIDFLQMGIPFDTDLPGGEGPNPFRNEGVRILHAPSEPVPKGTGAVRRQVAELRAQGHAIDYLELTGRPHVEVVHAISHCDLVIDEVFSDSPMAVLATEAASLGKPTVVTGYAADAYPQWLRGAATPPTLFAHPSRLGAAVESLVADADRRVELGTRAREFVRERWSRTAIAERFIRLITNQVAPEWIISPEEVHYVHGWGLEEGQLAEAVREVVALAGPSALLLDHNPGARDELLRLAGLPPSA